MYIRAKIVKINYDGTVLLSCFDGVCNQCKSRFFCNNKNQTEFLARNDKAFELSVNQTVEVFLSPGKTMLSVFLVFALPLMFFPVGYFTMAKFSFNELIRALGALVAISVSFCITAFINIRNKRSLMPVVTQVVSD